MKRIWLIGLLLIPLTSWAQDLPKVVLPLSITSEPGEWIIVAPLEINGGQPKWRSSPGLQEVQLSLLFPKDIADQAKGKVYRGKKGRYTVEAWNAKDSVVSDIAICVITIGDPEPDPQPGPSPGPVPKTGLRIMILEESGSMRSVGLLPSVRTKLDTLAKGNWRKFDQHVALSQLSPEWIALRSRCIPTSIPWVIAADSSGGIVIDLPFKTDSELLSILEGK